MSPAPVFTIRFGTDVQFPICNVADAAKALADLRWPRKGGAVYKDAVRMVDEALAGHCKVQAALEAFQKAAYDGGVLEKVHTAKK